jgi:hypothetical protein
VGKLLQIYTRKKGAVVSVLHQTIIKCCEALKKLTEENIIKTMTKECIFLLQNSRPIG